MKTNIFSKSLCAAAAVAVTTIGFSASANAGNRTERTAIVEYGDLDLTSADGKSTFNGRVKGAVRQVCGGYDNRSLVDQRDHRTCMDEANLSASRASVTILAAAEAGTLKETKISFGR
ncbi:MAG: hypothetical protein Pars2KO_07290 [Parasphingorhabdus sp.]